MATFNGIDMANLPYALVNFNEFNLQEDYPNGFIQLGEFLSLTYSYGDIETYPMIYESGIAVIYPNESEATIVPGHALYSGDQLLAALIPPRTDETQWYFGITSNGTDIASNVGIKAGISFMKGEHFEPLLKIIVDSIDN